MNNHISTYQSSRVSFLETTFILRSRLKIKINSISYPRCFITTNYSLAIDQVEPSNLLVDYFHRKKKKRMMKDLKKHKKLENMERF